MNPLFHSVRWRLQLWHALILMGVIVALCLLAHRLAAEDRRERIDQELESFERRFMKSFWELPSRAKPDGPPSIAHIRERFLSLKEAKEFPLEMRDLFDPAASDSTYIAFWDRHGNSFFRSANAPASLSFPALPEGSRDKRPTARGPFREIIQGGAHGARSIVGRDVSADRAALNRLGWQIAVSGALLWLLGLLGGWWLAGRAIHPIDAISLTASRIAGGELSERIDVSGGDNELSRLSQVLNQTFDRLAAAIDREREFTADASHELRTPLTVILSETSRGLKRDRPAEEYREIIATCGLAAERMRTLVESLLLLARQDGNHAKRNTPLDLADVVAEAAKLLQPLAANHNIDLETQLLPAPCHGDPNGLTIVATNLVSNAILHQPTGGQVTVRVILSNGHALLEVADTGPGIPADHLPRLFDRFYRVDAARGPASGHSGLGLAIVRAIVTNHGGSVDIESTLGEGTTFRVLLPSKQ